MLENFAHALAEAKKSGAQTIAVAVAQDKDVLLALKLAQDAEIAEAVLVGDAAEIKPMLQEVGLAADTRIVDEKDPAQAALKAVSLVRQGQAQVVMKGMLNTSDFLKAVLHPEQGLRSGSLLSHLAVFEVPGEKRLLYHTDGGMNIAPDLATKKGILKNALAALRALGLAEPKVAVLTANEQVHPKMQATVDAQSLVAAAAAVEFSPCVIEGPIALDVALNPEAARHKGIASRISGQVDLFLMPNIETGNVLGKSLLYYAGAHMAGLVLGATHPIVLTSRAETPEGKLHSICLACLAARKGN